MRPQQQRCFGQPSGEGQSSPGVERRWNGRRFSAEASSSSSEALGDGQSDLETDGASGDHVIGPTPIADGLPVRVERAGDADTLLFA